MKLPRTCSASMMPASNPCLADQEKFCKGIAPGRLRVAKCLYVRIREAFSEMLALANDGNKYFDDTKPWIEIKTDPVRTSHILYMCASLCRTIAVLSAPFLPNTADKILKQLNVPWEGNGTGEWDSAAEPLLEATHKVNPPEVLFARLEDASLQAFRAAVTEPADLALLFRK